MHVEEGISIAEVMKRFGIVSRRHFLAWCEVYRKDGPLGLKAKPKGRPGKMPQTPQAKMEYELNRLKMENELLRNFLYEAGRR
jgi:transposase